MSGFGGTSLPVKSYRRVIVTGVLSEADDIVKVNGGLTVSLPNPTTTYIGKTIYVSRFSPSAGIVTINVSGGSLLENSANNLSAAQSLTTARYGWVNNGTNWLMFTAT
jgi:hypothetical protein